ncbi:MAG: FecR domain-containing protein [Prolixibacteraceae bacterium]
MAKIDIDIETIRNFFKGQFRKEDETYVEEVFADDTKTQELKNYLSDDFDELKGEMDDSERKTHELILYKIHYEINTNRSLSQKRKFDPFIKWTLRLAGVIIIPLLLMIGIQSYKVFNLRKEVWVEIKAPAWTRAQFSLPDGTTGWLNSNSTVRYQGDFNDHRSVTLRGEAFFDVHKDSKHPFVVNTNEIAVRVLGTRFNVASYENEKIVEVVLEEGSIEFNEQGKDTFYTMKPNDLITYDKSRSDFTREEVQPQKYLAWTEGKLIFRNDPLDVIARKLERWYNIDVEINGNLSQNLRLRATFIEEDLEEVLALLKRSLPVDYKIESRGLMPDYTYAKKKIVISCK